MWESGILSLHWVKSLAENTLKYFFLQKIGSDISCKLSSVETSLFFGKTKKNTFIFNFPREYIFLVKIRKIHLFSICPESINPFYPGNPQKGNSAASDQGLHYLQINS